MGVHPRAVVAIDRLRHEGDAFPVPASGVLDDVLVGHHLVGHAGERGEAEVDLALSSGRDLVMVELARDADPLERQHHLRAKVVERVRRRRWEVALLRSRGVAETRLAGVPVPLWRVDRVVGAVRREVVVHLVEDEELALGAEVGGVGDPAGPEVLLGTACDAAGVLGVRLARDRIGDLADERERRHLGRRVEYRARRVRHEQHVGLGDRLPATDRRAVEAEPVVECRLLECRNRQRDVLPRSEQVAELEVDHGRLRLGRPLERLACVGQRLASVSQIVPVCDLRHSCHLRSVGPTKKTPGLRES